MNQEDMFSQEWLSYVVNPEQIPRRIERYDKLQGGSGKDIFFRERRLRPRDLGEQFGIELDGSVKFNVDGKAYKSVLRDVSTSGVSFDAQDIPLERETVLPELGVYVEDHELYQGKARVVHVTPADGIGFAVAGVHLQDSTIDMDTLPAIAVEKWLRSKLDQLSQILGSDNGSSQYKVIDREYKYVIGQVAYLFSGLMHTLDRAEYELRKLPVRTREKFQTRMLTEAWQKFWPEAQRLVHKAGKLTSHLYSREMDATKRLYRNFTEHMLLPYALRGPVIARAKIKPLGYPGDYMVMNYVYSNDTPHGRGLWAKIVHKWACEATMAAAVRARKNLVVNTLKTEIRRVAEIPHFKEFKIMSIGAGPAQEVFEFLNHPDADWLPKEVVVTLVDQDDEALTYTSRRLAELPVVRSRRARIVPLHLSFTQMLSYERAKEWITQQDVIYSVGLYDYLRIAVGKRLIAVMWNFLRDGGVMLIGNFGTQCIGEHSWILTFLLDWDLIYRTEQDMATLQPDLENLQDSSVITEATGLCYFLKLRKRQEDARLN